MQISQRVEMKFFLCGSWGGDYFDGCICNLKALVLDMVYFGG